MGTELQRKAWDPQLGEHDVWRAAKTLEIPLILIDLRNFTVVGAADSFFKEVEIPESEILGRDVFVLFEEEDRARAKKALHALAAGTIDFYRTHRQLANDTLTSCEVSIWVHVIDDGHRSHALAEITRSADLRVSPLVKCLGNTPYRFAIGIVDTHGVITSISTEVESVIGVTADVLIGRPLLRETGSKFWNRLHEGFPEVGPCLVSWPERSLQPPEIAGHVNCLVACLSGANAYCFILYRTVASPDRDQLDRAARLEGSLLRIAEEVKASGIFTGMRGLPDIERFPQLGSLTSRQWEVLTRLLRGERVATIASELFVSPSTVRNTLSSIFAKFGVHTQAELLDLLLH